MRYAIYYTPEKDDPLTRLAARWLGRDAFDGKVSATPSTVPLSANELASHTAAPRRYGFHATLKAPFRLADGESEQALVDALARFARSREPIHLPRIELRRIGGFFALVPQTPCAALERLAADAVGEFERFRKPLSPAEIERRNPSALTPGQLENLHKWGYPYVFEEFRFHMTLTGRVADNESARVERAIEAFFGPLLMEPLEIASLALFVEREPGAPFRVRSFHAMGSASQRMTA